MGAVAAGGRAHGVAVGECTSRWPGALWRQHAAHSVGHGSLDAAKRASASTLPTTPVFAVCNASPDPTPSVRARGGRCSVPVMVWYGYGSALRAGLTWWESGAEMASRRGGRTATTHHTPSTSTPADVGQLAHTATRASTRHWLCGARRARQRSVCHVSITARGDCAARFSVAHSITSCSTRSMLPALRKPGFTHKEWRRGTQFTKQQRRQQRQRRQQQRRQQHPRARRAAPRAPPMPQPQPPLLRRNAAVEQPPTIISMVAATARALRWDATAARFAVRRAYYKLTAYGTASALSAVLQRPSSPLPAPGASW